MWCERVVRNATEAELADREIDYVDIAWDECRSVLKKRSRGGQDVRVLLGRGQRVRHGDVLFEDSARALLVNVLPCEVVVVRSANPRLMAELALELGNLHWPTQIIEGEIIFPPSAAAMEAVGKLGMTYSNETRRFTPLPVRASGVNVSENLRILRPGQDQADPSRKVASSA